MTRRAIFDADRRGIFPRLAALPLAILLAAPLAAGQTSAYASGSAKAVQANIGLLQFVTQSTLSGQERGWVVQDVASGMRSAPEKVQHRDDLIAITLTNAAKFPKDALRLRELWRYDIAVHVPHDDAEYQIVERHDPTLVLDTAHQRMVTEQTLIALQNCTAWLMQNLHKPPPDQHFVSTERAYIRASYWRLGEDEQDAYAHVARNCPRAQDFFAGIVASQRASFFAKNAQQVNSEQLAGKDAALVSRIAYNIVLRGHGGSTAAQGRLFDYMVQQSLLNQQLQRSIMKNPPLPPPN